MKREEAEAQRERLQRDDHDHRYVVREQPAGDWDIVRTNMSPPTSHCVVAGRRAVSPTDAEQAAELADAARRLRALRERRARLANVPGGKLAAGPEDPRPFVVRQIPGFG
jgi:hypothetical protein